MPPKMTDLTGQAFGRLTVTRYAGSDRRHQSHWTCRCECGGEVTVRRDALVSGITTSCGCRRRETQFQRAEVITYNSAHHRTRRARGSAGDRECRECGQPASEWSYVGNCPDEQEGLANGSAVRYCPVGDEHEDCYTARCVPCHRRADQKGRAA